MFKHLENGDSEPKVDRSKLIFYIFQFCPFSRRVALTLSHHGIEHDRIYINIKKKPDWFITINPTGKVPMIEQEGEKLLDSEMICRYLDQLIETDNLIRASDENSIKFVNEWWANIFKSFHAIAFQKEFSEDQKETFLKALEDFEKIPGTGFITGDNVGLADFLVYPIMELIDICLTRLKQPPIIGNINFRRTNLWFQRMNELPAVQKERIPEEIHREYMKTILEIPI